MNETEIIQGARELLSDPAKWGKGSAQPTPESYCAVNAISHSIPVGQYRRGRLDQVCVWMRKFVPGGEALSIYNDAPSTTHADILNVLDKALADLGGLA